MSPAPTLRTRFLVFSRSHLVLKLRGLGRVGSGAWQGGVEGHSTHSSLPPSWWREGKGLAAPHRNKNAIDWCFRVMCSSVFCGVAGVYFLGGGCLGCRVSGVLCCVWVLFLGCCIAGTVFLRLYCIAVGLCCCGGALLRCCVPGVLCCC